MPTPEQPQPDPAAVAAKNAAARAAAQALPPIDPGQRLTPEHRELSNRAMTLADRADSEKRRGRSALARQWYRMALHYELENLALYGRQQGLLSSIAHRSAGWLALHAGDPALARDLAERGLSREPHPMIKPELEDLRRQADYKLLFPNHPELRDRVVAEPLCLRPPTHPGPRQGVPGGHGHHAGYPDKTETWFRKGKLPPQPNAEEKGDPPCNII